MPHGSAAASNPLVPEAKLGRRPEAYPKREILNAIFSLLRSGYSWRIVYHYFRQWQQDGTWQVMHDMLRGDVRVAAGKHRQPSAGIIDSQSVKLIRVISRLGYGPCGPGAQSASRWSNGSRT